MINSCLNRDQLIKKPKHDTKLIFTSSMRNKLPQIMHKYAYRLANNISSFKWLPYLT